MKSQQKINLFFFLIIIGLIVALVVVLTKHNTYLENPTPTQFDEFQLMEVKSKEINTQASVYGLVNSKDIVEVRMSVNGKIDHDNRPLRVGSSFKKNDLLIKVDRLEVLYDLLVNRLNYKKKIQESLPRIKEEFPQELTKWKQFESNIERTLPLPELPIFKSKEEEKLLNELNITPLYFTIKKIERRAEDYIYAAPFDGYISESSISPNSVVKANSLLMKISKNNSLQVTSHVPIQSLKTIEMATKVYFVNSKNDTIGQGKFKRVGSEISDSSHVEVFFTISPQSQTIHNSLVQIVLPEEQQKIGINLPVSAVINNKVYLYSTDKILETPVNVLSSKQDSVQVEGLPPHCFVIVNTEKVGE